MASRCARRYRGIGSPSCGAPTSFCMVGDSHGRNLCKRLAGCRAVTQEHVGTTITPTSQRCRGMDGLARCCRTGPVFLHVGQWDLGWPSKNLTLWGASGARFHATLRSMVGMLREVFGQRLELMATHPNPLNCATTQCEPTPQHDRGA